MISVENKSYDWDSLLFCQQAFIESERRVIKPNGETDMLFQCEQAGLHTYEDAGVEVDEEAVRCVIVKTLPEYCSTKCPHYHQRLATHSLRDNTGSSQ